ncbi:hypothetical protein J19TS1_51420 [Heyndrickxia oleronia]|nr:hypothetical protein J19TS1_51420 [Heyndrickxia oleronia]
MIYDILLQLDECISDYEPDNRNELKDAKHLTGIGQLILRDDMVIYRE